MPNRHLSIQQTDLLPNDFTEEIITIINRIISDPAVHGIVYFRNDMVYICTVPEYMHSGLTKLLPPLSPMIHQAVTEINVIDELVAYRISTSTLEILVTGGREFGAVVVQGRRPKNHLKHKNK